jgi:hypothetical protein
MVPAVCGGQMVTPGVKTPARGLDVLAILPFGYPVEAVGRGKKQRKPLEDGSPLGRVRPALHNDP